MKIRHTCISAPAAVIFLLLSSCSKDFLDTKIDTYDTPESIITNRGTLFSFANSMYASLPNGFTALDGNLFSPASDESFQIQSSATNVRLFNQGTLSPLSGGNTNEVYKSLYDGIRAANFFLDYSANFHEFLLRNRDTTTASSIVAFQNDSANISWFRAEAHVARAYYYSELIKRFGGVPIVNTVFNPSVVQDIPQSAYDDVVKFIVDEIDQHIDSLQENWKTSDFKSNDGRFSRMSALALKSRVLLYAASPLHNPGGDKEKWKLAAAAAKEVMTTPGFHLALYGGGYGQLFQGSTPITGTNNEVIFAVRAPASNTPETNNYPIGTPGGNSGVVPSQNLVADYEYTGTPDPFDPYANRDPRLAATVVTNGSNWNGRVIDQSPGKTDDMTKANASKTGFYLRKFLSENLNLVQGGTAQHNWIIFRYAEILLNYAEAVNEAYGPDVTPPGYPMTAKAALQMVRDRASTLLPAVTATGTDDFRAVIKHERRIEFAFEDHRYWDLLRWKDAEQVLKQPLKGVKVSRNPDNTFSYTVINVSNRFFNAPAMYYFPFPQAEISNSKGTLQQNPGY